MNAPGLITLQCRTERVIKQGNGKRRKVIKQEERKKE
jgi:hypothetical protein